MKTLYLDCFAGISGDMMAGALIDLGLDPARLETELRKLPVGGYQLQVSRVMKNGLQAVRFEVFLAGQEHLHLADSEYQEEPPPGAGHQPAGHQHDALDHASHSHDIPPRPLQEILALIEAGGLSARAKNTALAIFRRLGQAEARVHGVPFEAVHLHEVGGIDAIVDVCSTAIGLDLLGIDQVIASPLHLGSGFVRSAHGLMPVPAPATAELLRGVPVYTTRAPGELVTPTGAAIVTGVAGHFGPLPSLQLQAVGYGAGKCEREFPNVLRAFLGEPFDSSRQPRDPYPQQHGAPTGPAGYHESPAVVLEANLDDMPPQLYEALLERLLAAGALDVTLCPVQMKKSRPGIHLQVLSSPDLVDALLEVIFLESTTLGVRTYPVTKRMLQRELLTVETPLGPVRFKVARLGERVVNAWPEYEDCRSLARQLGLPVKEVYFQVLRSFPSQPAPQHRISDIHP